MTSLLPWGVAHLAELEALSRRRRLRTEPGIDPGAARDRILESLSRVDRDRLTSRFLDLLDNSERLGLKMSHPGSFGWPGLLSDISAPPFMLWMKGDPAALHPPGIAIVGAREAGSDSLLAVTALSREVARLGLCVVSGMARGVDGAAHLGALAAAGRTIAVVGTGLDRVYPASHRFLETEILAGGGLVLSEFPPGDLPEAWHFPHRNRLIVGLSVAVVAGLTVAAREHTSPPESPSKKAGKFWSSMGGPAVGNGRGRIFLSPKAPGESEVPRKSSLRSCPEERRYDDLYERLLKSECSKEIGPGSFR